MTLRLETSASTPHYGNVFPAVPTRHRGSLGGAGKMVGRKRNFDGFGLGQYSGVMRVAAGVVEFAIAELHEEQTWLFRFDDLWPRLWGGAG